MTDEDWTTCRHSPLLEAFSSSKTSLLLSDSCVLSSCRIHPNVTDQHKSVGLAGASLLQLAVSGAYDVATHQPSMSRKGTPPGGSANLSKDPWNSGAEPGFSVEEPRRNGRPQVAAEASESGSGASPPRTRFPEPVSGEVPSRDVKPEATAERRTVGTGASPLPSLGALLDEIPRTHLKRPREARNREHGTGSVALTLSSAPVTPSSAVTASSSAVTSSKSSSSSNPSLTTYPSQPVLPPSPLEAPGTTLSMFGDGIGSCTSKGKGMAKMDGVNHDTDGSKKSGGAMDEGSHCASAPSAVSSQHRSAAGAKRLFTGPQRGSWRWQTAGTGWNPQLPLETGFLTRSPTPDWRQAGLSSVGRTASLEEAQAAARRQGLEVDNGKPRRASAFFTHGSSLPPVVTEMRRRCSALESRRAPIRAPHYSELLSAQAPLRSVTASAGGVERHRLFPGSERQHGAGAENEPEARLGIFLLEPAVLPSIQSLTSPPPNRQLSSDGAAGHNRPLDEDAAGVRFAPYISPAKRVFHIIPAAAAYMAGSALPSRGAGFPANASLPSRLEWQRERLPPPERFSLSSRTALEVSEPEIARGYCRALRATPQKEQGHFPTMNERFVAAEQDSRAFVPAWGAVVEGEAGYVEKRDDTSRYNAGAAYISSGAALSGQRAAVSGGYSSGERNAPSHGCSPRTGSRLSEKGRGTLSGGLDLSHPRRPSTLEQSSSVAGIHELSHPKSPGAELPPQPTNSATLSPGAEGQAGSSSHAWRRSTAERPSKSPSKQGNIFREAADEAHTIVKGSAVKGGPAHHNFDLGFNSGPGSVRRGSVAPALETMEPSMRPSMSRRPLIAPSVLAARETKDTLTAQPGRLQRDSFVGEK